MPYRDQVSERYIERERKRSTAVTSTTPSLESDFALKGKEPRKHRVPAQPRCIPANIFAYLFAPPQSDKVALFLVVAAQEVQRDAHDSCFAQWGVSSSREESHHLAQRHSLCMVCGSWRVRRREHDFEGVSGLRNEKQTYAAQGLASQVEERL